MITRSLSKRDQELEKVKHQNNSQETSKALVREVSDQNANETGHRKGYKEPQRRRTKAMPNRN